MNNVFTKLTHIAGGKGWAFDQFMDFLPSDFGGIYLPFVGRADIIQILRAHGDERHVFASDISIRLALCHLAVRDCPEKVISVLEEHRQKHSPDYYVEIRDRFHPKMPLAQAGGDYVYISRNAYWGVLRMSVDGRCTNINARTNFNFSPEAVRKHSQVLRNTTVVAEDYAATAMRAKPGDLVILDPPYPDEGSVYGCLGFTTEDHYRLRNVCDELNRKQVLFLMTNGDTPFIRHIYRNFSIQTIEAPRTLGRAKNGGTKTELVITNY